MNYEIEFVNTVGYIIRERPIGTMLPMIFTTYEAAETQKRFLDNASRFAYAPVEGRECGDLEYPRQKRR